MATMRDVAKRAGVSLTTVSHVINETRYVSESVKQRVFAAMEELDYRPNELARSLRRGQTNTIGLVLPDSANPYFAEIGRAIEALAFEAGYSVILGNTYGEIDKEDVYVEVLRTKQVDGIIFVAAGDRTTSVRSLLERHFPFVLVDRDLGGVSADVVMVDNHQGGLVVTRHLIGLGHRRIGIVTGPSILTPSADRINGYCKALEEAGIPCEEELLVAGDFRPNSGYHAALHLLDLSHPPTAIFACNDMMAIGVLRAAAERGCRVPDDLAVVGFDNIELAQYTIPALTTFGQPIEDIAQVAVSLLSERIDRPEETPRRVILPGELVIRGSCGAQRS
ncbi:MAG: substrate-binding domain-containing protein [Anaerolineae bacterium]